MTIDFENYRISSYTHGWVIHERMIKSQDSNDPGAEYFTNPKYYATLKKALIKLMDLELGHCEASDIRDVLSKIEQTKRNILSAVKSHTLENV